MSKIKILSMAVIGLLLINLTMTGFLFLRKPPTREPLHIPPEDRPKMIIIERLHFDKEQVSQYERLIEQHRRSIRELDEQLRKAKNDLYSTLTDASMNKDSLENRVGQIQKQIEDIHYNHFADIKKLCKPDQISLFNELTADLAKFFAPGKNHPPPPRD